MADLDQVEQIPDPAERARELGRRMSEVTQWHSRMAAMRRAAVIEMKDDQGLSYAEIGRQLKLHRNRVQKIYEGRAEAGKSDSAAAEA